MTERKQQATKPEHTYGIEQLRRLPDLRADVLSVVLEPGKEYTKDEARALHDEFMKREVK